MDLNDKLRLMQVKRYPICHVNRDQSVAEHSYNVLLIAQELAKETRDVDIFQEVTAYALVHDIEEVFTGDIPSSFKRELRDKCPSIIPLLDSGALACPPEIKAIVKLADCLEAMYYITEFGGSRLADRVLVDITQNFERACQTTKVPARVVMKAQEIWRSFEQ